MFKHLSATVAPLILALLYHVCSTDVGLPGTPPTPGKVGYHLHLTNEEMGCLSNQSHYADAHQRDGIRTQPAPLSTGQHGLCCATLVQPLNFPGPRFPHLESRDNNSASLLVKEIVWADTWEVA